MKANPGLILKRILTTGKKTSRRSVRHTGKICEHAQQQERMKYPNPAAGMSPQEIRLKLKEMGFPTRVRNMKRLQELYQLALE